MRKPTLSKSTQSPLIFITLLLCDANSGTCHKQHLCIQETCIWRENVRCNPDDPYLRVRAPVLNGTSLQQNILLVLYGSVIDRFHCIHLKKKKELRLENTLTPLEWTFRKSWGKKYIYRCNCSFSNNAVRNTVALMQTDTALFMCVNSVQ